MDDIEETISLTQEISAIQLQLSSSETSTTYTTRTILNLSTTSHGLLKSTAKGEFQIGRGKPGAEALKRILQGETGEIAPDFDEFDIKVDDIRFGAFFALCRLYEHRGELEEVGELLDDYEAEFGDHPLFQVLRSEGSTIKRI
jgi:hypothetical protein